MVSFALSWENRKSGGSAEVKLITPDTINYIAFDDVIAQLIYFAVNFHCLLRKKNLHSSVRYSKCRIKLQFSKNVPKGLRAEPWMWACAAHCCDMSLPELKIFHQMKIRHCCKKLEFSGRMLWRFINQLVLFNKQASCERNLGQHRGHKETGRSARSDWVTYFTNILYLGNLAVNNTINTAALYHGKQDIYESSKHTNAIIGQSPLACFYCLKCIIMYQTWLPCTWCKIFCLELGDYLWINKIWFADTCCLSVYKICLSV